VFDFNELYFFAQVVEHKGFAAAARKIGIPKSKLSRRVPKPGVTLEQLRNYVSVFNKRAQIGVRQKVNLWT